jgi:hypothetical protein
MEVAVPVDILVLRAVVVMEMPLAIMVEVVAVV